MRVRIVLDVICVHSYLGYTRFARAADRMRADGHRVHVRFLPFELAPGAGTEGRPLLPVLEQAFGAQAVEQSLRLAERAAADGLEIDYERAVATGTFDAHLLIMRAARQDRAEQMVERLFRAHFTDGLHIGDPGTLARLAEEAGVRPDDSAPGDADLLRAELDRVRGPLGVTGVPVFLFEDAPPMVGSQSRSALCAALKKAVESALAG